VRPRWVRDAVNRIAQPRQVTAGAAVLWDTAARPTGHGAAEAELQLVATGGMFGADGAANSDENRVAVGGLMG